MRKYCKILFGLLRLIKECILNVGKLELHGFQYCICTGVKIWLHNSGKCDLGRKTWLSEYCCFESNKGYIKLGYNNFFNTNCQVVSMDTISIGNNNLFGPHVVIVDHDHNFENLNELICRQGVKTAPISIGSDNWICANVTICAGTSIGEHIVIAANSVVKGKLEISGIYGGCPAKLIKPLEY